MEITCENVRYGHLSMTLLGFSLMVLPEKIGGTRKGLYRIDGDPFVRLCHPFMLEVIG